MKIGKSTRSNAKYYHKVHDSYGGRKRYACEYKTIWGDWEFGSVDTNTLTALAVLTGHDRMTNEERAFWMLKGIPTIVLQGAPCPRCFPETKMPCPTCSTPIPSDRYKQATAKKSRRKKVAA